MRADTIFALSSGSGRAAISIVRVSGPAAGVSLKALTGRSQMPRPRQATLATLQRGGRAFDRAMVLWLPGPGTATGEDVVEFHIHGGPAVLRVALSALGDIPGLRMAEPGEFTRRAFLNGKLDLTQAEGVGDLIDAETELQASQALWQMEGAVRDIFEGWRERIVRGLAHVEAVLDFPDEDVPDAAANTIAPDLRSVMDEIRRRLDDGTRGEIIRDGLSVVLIGPPNSGKSSLLNALARRDIAIVSDIAGTTRDILEARLNISGLAINLVDTAGLRDAVDSIETEGIRRALRRAESAQVRLLLVDQDSVVRLPSLLSHLRGGDLVVWTKADQIWTPPTITPETLAVSAQTGEGLDMLMLWLGDRALALAGGGTALITRERHREALRESASALARGLVSLGIGLDLAAEDLRVAAQAIGRITGRVNVEDILDVIFRDFCIGK